MLNDIQRTFYFGFTQIVSIAYIMSSRPAKPTLFLEWVRHGGSHLLSQYFGGQCMRPAMSLNLGLYSEFQGSLDQKQKQKKLRLTVFVSSAPVHPCVPH